MNCAWNEVLHVYRYSSRGQSITYWDCLTWDKLWRICKWTLPSHLFYTEGERKREERGGYPRDDSSDAFWSLVCLSVLLKIHVSVTSFMFALHFLRINIPRAVACHHTTEDTASLLACLLWLLIVFLLFDVFWYQNTQFLYIRFPCYSHLSSTSLVIGRPVCILFNENFDCRV
jgi:hypothetical protein